MKKVISIFLVCLMLIPFASLTAFADDGKWEVAEQYDGTYEVNAGESIIISADAVLTGTITVNEGGKVDILENGGLTISGNGRIKNNGTVTVENGGQLLITARGTSTPTEDNTPFFNDVNGVLNFRFGGMGALGEWATMYNKGKINGIENLNLLGKLYHSVEVFDTFTQTYQAGETYDRKEKQVTFTVKYLADSELVYDSKYGDVQPDLYYTMAEIWNAKGHDVKDNSANDEDFHQSVYVEHNTKFYILCSPSTINEENGGWVDTTRMKLKVDGNIINPAARVDASRGVFCVTPTDSITLDTYSTSYKDIVKLFTVVLPRTEGYYCATHDGTVDEVTVPFGQTLSFRVVLNPDYDRSTPTAYVSTSTSINVCQLQPDEYGYYDVTGPLVDDKMSTTGGVQQNFQITVMGIIKNETRDTANSIVTFIQEIFEVIKEFFSYFKDLFAGLGNIGGGANP